MKIEDIIAKISQKFPELVYVGKDYSVADLIKDMRQVDVSHAEEVEDAAMEVTEWLEV